MERDTILIELIGQLHRVIPTLELREYEPMSRHTTFRIGGPARLMALPTTESEAVAAVNTAVALGIPPVFIGNGSNLLVSDVGIDGFVVKPSGLHTIVVKEYNLHVWSGMRLSQVASLARDRGLSGLEFAHGIPGSIGGAVTMNAGAYGGEMKQVVTAVTVLSEAGIVSRLTANALEFSYRHSTFSNGRRLILHAELGLTPQDPALISARMELLMEQRRAKQPLEYPSGGSTFQRPNGHFAAALIDECGLKGATVGGAQVSEKHAGFVINRGGATCRDILLLVEQIRETVLRNTGITLELELKLLGS